MTIRYPEIKIRLTPEDVRLAEAAPHEAAFALINRVRQALKEAGVPTEEREEFLIDASETDYEHAVETCREWINLEEEGT